MARQRRVSGGDQFYRRSDHEVYRPLQVSLKPGGGYLIVEQTNEIGGPGNTSKGWRVVSGRVRAMKIGTGEWTTFPPEGTHPLIFFPSRKR